MNSLTSVMKQLKKSLSTFTLTLKIIKKTVKFTYKANPKVTILLFTAFGIFATFGLIGNFLNSLLIDNIVGVTNGSKDMSFLVLSFSLFVIFHFIASTESSITNYLDQYNYIKAQRYVLMKITSKISSLDFYYLENADHLNLISNVRENAYKVINFIDLILWYFRYLIILTLALIVLLKF